MGRRKGEKVKMCRINNNGIRNDTFRRRSKCFLKKIKEISTLCDKYVYMIMFDAETGQLD